MEYSYPPLQQPATYTAEQVEDVRKNRIAEVRRLIVMMVCAGVFFALALAGLLGYLFYRELNNSTIYVRQFRWYFGLLVGLVIFDIIGTVLGVRQMRRKLSWLENLQTPPQLIMDGRYSNVFKYQRPQAYPEPNYAPQQGPPTYYHQVHSVNNNTAYMSLLSASSAQALVGGPPALPEKAV
ncbi:hypothetical protein BX661DRAFT_176069, partial [Kickxella alabastrina]|uniref:uncharacterized protein n=1 Tax=Kickxella alabastrina TaxID=61397 RepID=UPI00221E9D23